MRFTKTGKIKHFKAGKGHLLTCKASKRKRLLGKAGFVSTGEAGNIRKILPYGA
jgi:ribosomal protein L35